LLQTCARRQWRLSGRSQYRGAKDALRRWAEDYERNGTVLCPFSILRRLMYERTGRLSRCDSYGALAIAVDSLFQKVLMRFLSAGFNWSQAADSTRSLTTMIVSLCCAGKSRSPFGWYDSRICAGLTSLSRPRSRHRVYSPVRLPSSEPRLREEPPWRRQCDNVASGFTPTGNVKFVGFEGGDHLVDGRSRQRALSAGSITPIMGELPAMAASSMFSVACTRM